ncbi:MAG: hypothetical protein SD837_20405 [Candidatus Electrothrix scaldis]|nr:MAG: hypothetical protein SD837_20405 [Candidatus Electrothrix sp. GW3-3]
MKDRVGIMVLLVVSSVFFFVCQGGAADYARISGAIYPGMQLEKINESHKGRKDLKLMNAAAQARKIALDRLETETLHAT